MIFNFIYLDKDTLSGYAAQIDGGLIAETKTRNARSKSAEAGLGFRWLSAKIGGKTDGEHQQTLSDAPEAQFQRLIAAANLDPDALAWNDVLEPGNHFEAIQVGELIKWECDLDIPTATRLVSKNGAGAQALSFVESFLDTGLDGQGNPLLPGVPNPAQRAELEKLRLQAAFFKQAIATADVKPCVIGSDPDTQWKVFGNLHPDHLLAADIEKERLIVVGKVKRILATGESRKLITVGFEQMAILGGRQEKDTSNDSPDAIAESATVHGPALELDILAICR